MKFSAIPKLIAKVMQKVSREYEIPKNLIIKNIKNGMIRMVKMLLSTL